MEEPRDLHSSLVMVAVPSKSSLLDSGFYIIVPYDVVYSGSERYNSFILSFNLKCSSKYGEHTYGFLSHTIYLLSVYQKRVSGLVICQHL